ncbi:amidase family protein [Methylobacterium sp. GC_Met_2]|uniref:amidase n=1 Tax=Methylobacterium sp. GC_Met_2 TaxID=2937376 RepID=UPI00226B3F34|nr:amidase family protein [Methylobacterium sp. GC_Met_2]
MADDLAYMPAAELATLIRTRRLSPVELMTATLARIARAQPVLNAFITVAEEQALAGARAAEAAVMRGEPLAPLHGLPVSIKDLVPTAGIRTTWGSRVFAENVPEADAEVVTRLKASGAIVVGKTTTPEFGQQCLTQAPLFGRTRNAWDAGRTSGGSSGGAAVAAAAGLTALGVATDGGGSTRIPAACNGVVGFKQGLGVVPQEYAQDGFGNISYVTPMTRTVRDTALMLDAMAGPDPRDPLSAGRLQPGFVATLDAVSPGTKSLAGLRVGWRPLLGNAHVAADVLAACERAVAALADLGAETRGHAAPFENPETLWFVSNGAYRMAQFGHHLARHREILCPTFVRQMDRVRDVSAAELYAAIFARTALYRQVQAWFDDIDVLAMPTLSRTALPIDQDFFGPITIDGTPVPNLRAAWYPYTMPFNLTGNPAVSLPCGLDEAGVPVAIQLVGRVGEDARLLRVAAAFERAMPWADRRPPLPELD